MLIFATLPKFAMIAFAIKLFIYLFYEYSSVWYTVLIFSGLLSVILGTFAALNQVNVKRLYAYSAIVNVGYLISALAYGSFTGFIATFNYLLAYMLSTFCIFSILLMFRTATGLNKIKNISEYRVFAAYSSIFSVLLSLLFFSLAGVPPLAGFFIKFFLFKIIFMVDFLLNPAVFVILVTSVLSAFYYIRVVRFTFFDPRRIPILFLPIDKLSVLIFVAITFAILLFFVLQQFLLLFIGVALTTFLA